MKNNPRGITRKKWMPKKILNKGTEEETYQSSKLIQAQNFHKRINFFMQKLDSRLFSYQ